MAISDALSAAFEDYVLLLDRGYPAQATIKLVGDRHRLSADERLVLFRGGTSSSDAERRSAKLARPGPGAVILVDLYNVAFTIVHYLVGKPCFISRDGLLRDAGANYGRVPHEDILARAFDLLASRLIELRPSRIEAFVDAPVSRSGGHAELFRAALAAARRAALSRAGDRVSADEEGEGPIWNVCVAHSADGAVNAALEEFAHGPAEGRSVFVVSADSVLVDRAPRIFDAAREILEDEFGARLDDLSPRYSEICKGFERTS
jgi:hypothetical protein